MAVEVVAVAASGTEHGGHPGGLVRVRVQRQLGQHQLLVREGIPDDEHIVLGLGPPGRVAEEDAAVAGVEREQAALVGADRAEGASRDEAADGKLAGLFLEVDDEAEHGARAVELAVPAAEAAVGDEAAPGLAGEGGAEEARRVVRRASEEHLFHDLVGQRRRRRESHAAALGYVTAGGEWSERAAVAAQRSARPGSGCLSASLGGPSGRSFNGPGLVSLLDPYVS